LAEPEDVLILAHTFSKILGANLSLNVLIKMVRIKKVSKENRQSTKLRRFLLLLNGTHDSPNELIHDHSLIWKKQTENKLAITIHIGLYKSRLVQLEAAAKLVFDRWAAIFETCSCFET